MEEKKSLLLEGLLPVDLWNAIIVVLVLFGVFMAVFKGIVAIRDEVQKRKEKNALKATDITDKIAGKVMEQMTAKIDQKFDEFSGNLDKRFDDIDRKLASDKQLLEMHTIQLNAHEDRVSRLEGGNRALCHGVLALLEKDTSLAKAQHAMQNYLINGIYKEDDWE